MTAIIFGAGGQDGFYLTELLKQKQVKVIGISRNESFINIDISSYQEVSAIINLNKPELYISSRSKFYHKT